MEIEGLIGRDVALAAVSDALGLTSDDGDALLLVGERGIGKTACLLAARRMARTHRHVVLETAGSQSEMRFPFAGLQRLLRPLLSLVNTLPEVQARALLGALGMDDEPRRNDLAVSAAAMTLLGRAAETHGLAIIADDVQWLDEESLLVLSFVARRLEGRRMSMIAASSAAAGTTVGAALGVAFTEVTLNRLDDTEAYRVLARHAAGLGRVQRTWVVAQAVGNPSALLELARSVGSIDLGQLDPVSPVWPLPPSLQTQFAGCIPDLPASARDAVLVAAAASEGNLPEILAATAQLSGRAVDTAVLDTPHVLGLVSVGENRVEFTHPLVKAAVLHRESVTRRQAAHQALGAVITVNSYRRAWHRALGTATQDDAIAAELEATTPDSIRHGHVPAAISALQRAAQLSTQPVERGRRLLLAATQAARLGQPETVSRLLDAALRTELSPFDQVRAELLGEDCDGTVIGDSSRVRALCGMAGRAAAAGQTALSVELAEAAARRRCVSTVDADALAQLTLLAEGLARGSGDARALTVLALADPIGHGREVLSLLPNPDETSVTDGDRLTAYGVAARAVGDYATAAVMFDRAEVALRARGLLGSLARNLCVAADLRVDLGEWERASAALLGFEVLSAASMSTSHRGTARMVAARLAALRGESSVALELVSQVEHAPSARSGSRLLARAQIVRGIAAISAGHHLDAYVALSRVFDPRDPSHHFREQFDAVAYLAEAAAHNGWQDDARVVVRSMRRLADQCASPLLLAQLAYADAVLASDDTAEPVFLSALASDACSSPWQRARLQLAYGRWLRRRQRVSESRGPLRAALDVFELLGAKRWTVEARDELQASGVRDAARRGSPPPLLSTQELKIAQLAAQGLSNREIGQQLYLSPRTVGSHLYRIFPKLGISTRGQLAAQLTERSAPSCPDHRGGHDRSRRQPRRPAETSHRRRT